MSRRNRILSFDVKTVPSNLTAVPEAPARSESTRKPTAPPIDYGIPSDDLKIILTLTYADGSPIFTPESAYEITSMIQALGFQPAVAYLSTQPTDYKALVFGSPLLQEARDKAEIDIEIYRNKVTAVEGIHQCRKCGSKETISVQMQRRSADEPMSTIVTCVICKAHWST